ncbi:proopiomelanocortin a [Salminus brasiliensis]|uniref:proopiomelanocortin a n=1 Tax=Salminus brasiliensis TaxID=930266 RepID=UPI003B82E1B3
MVLRMVCPAWLLTLAMLCANNRDVKAQCWDNTPCRDLSSEENILDCIKLCKSDLKEESPLFPGESHLQPFLDSMTNEIPVAQPPVSLSTGVVEEAPEPGTLHEDKRSYSMEHFRWGKPVGRKRRPIKVFTNGVEEESAEALPGEMKRELATGGDDYPVEDSSFSQQEKKDGSYKMNHFRWSGPPASKRYGGFMKSWDERSQKPLLTLFKNVINKDGHQKKDH